MEWMNSNLKEIEPTNISNQEQKEKIAKEIAQKVKDGDVIGFGSGSTSYLLRSLRKVSGRLLLRTSMRLTFTDTGSSLKPLLFHLSSVLKTSSQIYSSRVVINPLLSKSGIKSAGDMNPHSG